MTIKNSHNKQLTVHMRGIKKKHIGAKTLSLHEKDIQSFADGACRCVKMCLHRFHISRSQKSNSMKSAIVACFRHNSCCLSYVRSLESSKVQKQYPLYRSCWFSDITVSQGSIATRLRCGGIFNVMLNNTFVRTTYYIQLSLSSYS